MNQIMSQLRRGFGYRFWLATTASAALIIFSFIHPLLKARQEGAFLYQGYHEVLFSDALFSDNLTFFLPVLAALPFATAYLEDIKSKFARFIVIRSSYSGYLIGQIISCWICGSLVVLFGLVEVYGITLLVFAPIERIETGYTPGDVNIVERLILLTLNGGLWAVVGITMSTIMESKYIAYVFPFIAYYLLIIIYERYLPSIWLLSPKNWLNPTLWTYGIGRAILFLLELTFLCGLIFYIRGKRRLEQL